MHENKAQSEEGELNYSKLVRKFARDCFLKTHMNANELKEHIGNDQDNEDEDAKEHEVVELLEENSNSIEQKKQTSKSLESELSENNGKTKEKLSKSATI